MIPCSESSCTRRTLASPFFLLFSHQISSCVLHRGCAHSFQSPGLHLEVPTSPSLAANTSEGAQVYTSSNTMVGCAGTHGHACTGGKQRDGALRRGARAQWYQSWATPWCAAQGQTRWCRGWATRLCAAHGRMGMLVPGPGNVMAPLACCAGCTGMYEQVEGRRRVICIVGYQPT
jgi:hypothetical protein